jgi:hypothetical protein
MNTTTRRFPRTSEEAFGPNPWPLSGPYRRGAGVPRLLGRALMACVAFCALSVIAARLVP